MKNKLLKSYFFSLLACIFFSSCSSNNTSNLTSNWDPIEPINRAVFSFNMAVDTFTMEPVAKVYDYIVPEFLSNSLSRHFNWIKSPVSAINSSMQGKHEEAFLTIANFSINIFTLGFYNLADDQSNSNKEDFDQTLATYNFKAGPYTKESYDSAALIMLAMQAANSTNSNDFKSKVMDVANAPGEKIFPGELAKGLKLLSEGKEIDYVGASAVELIGGGESAGNFAEILIDNQKVTTVGYK